MSISPNEILASLNEDKAKKDLDRFFNSPSYSELERQLSVNNAKFSELPEPVKLVSLYLNQLGLDSYLEDMWRLHFRIKPPSIEEYLTVEHGGPFVEKIYEGWNRVLMNDFHSSFKRQIPNEIVLSGCIGSGKTSIARFLLIWDLLKVCCLINPQATMDVTQETLLVLALFTVTLDKASLALIKPFVSLLDQSPYFEAVDKPKAFEEYKGKGVVPYVVRSKYVEFPNNVIINMGSKVEHAISYSMFGAILDEAEFSAHGGGPERAFALYTNLKERIRSRFLGSQYTLLALVSSSRYSQGIIADYIKNTDPNDPLTKIYSFAIWDIKHFNAYKNSGHFHVLVGNKSNPHRILGVEESIAVENGKFIMPAKCQVIKVPEVYRKDFQNRITEAIQNLAGIAVTHSATFIFVEEPVECEELCPELVVETNLGNYDNIFSKLPDTLFTNVFNVKKFKIAPTAPRYVHLDLAETGVGGLSVIHPEVQNDKIVYVSDVLLELTTVTKIDISEIKKFLESLSSVCHIKSFTTDQYQSTQLRQEAIINHVADKVELFSVIKTTEPYETLSRIVQNKQFFIGNCPRLKSQMANVQVSNDNKIYKPEGISVGHYDTLDAVVGAVVQCVYDLDKHITHDVKEWYKAVEKDTTEFSLEGFDKI